MGGMLLYRSGCALRSTSQTDLSTSPPRTWRESRESRVESRRLEALLRIRRSARLEGRRGRPAGSSCRDSSRSARPCTISRRQVGHTTAFFAQPPRFIAHSAPSNGGARRLNSARRSGAGVGEWLAGRGQLVLACQSLRERRKLTMSGFSRACSRYRCWCGY